MREKTKGRTGGDRATPKNYSIRNYSPTRNLINLIHSRIKVAVVRLALSGWISYRMADFLIQRGGLSNA
jgi:hypothetical protein